MNKTSKTTISENNQQKDEGETFCFVCESGKFEVIESSICQQYKGEMFDVITPICICKNCGWKSFGKGQADELRKRTVNAYLKSQQSGR